METRMASASAIQIGISGSYGGLNTGDEAILHSMIAQIRRSLPAGITVFTRSVEDTRRRHAVDRAVSLRGMSRAEAAAEIKPLDLFVLGGGGILFDGEAEIFLRDAMIAHDLGVPVMVYAVSAGPLVKASTRELAREALNRAALVTVRDRQARQLLEEIGVVREVIVTADPALLLEPEPLPAEALKLEGLDRPSRPLVAFSVREPGGAAPDINVRHYQEVVANGADFMIRRYSAQVVFVPLERHHMDLQYSHAAISRMQCVQHAAVLKGDYSPGQLVSLLTHFQLAVGMRLHFLIFSALANVPFIALPYASKVTGFIQDLEMEAPPLDKVNSARLIALIDQAWDERDSIRARVQHRLPAVMDRARSTTRLLVELASRVCEQKLAGARP
jgi:polysaccharide pyruvyl transferase CsaB